MSEDHETLRQELAHYKDGYEQANTLCSQLMEMSDALQTQVETLKGQIISENQKISGERDAMKKQFANQLNELQEQSRIEQSQIAAALRSEQEKIVVQKDKEIERIQGQLSRLFEHYNGENQTQSQITKTTDQASGVSGPTTFDIEKQEKFIELKQKAKNYEEQYNIERKRASDLESKFRLQERIKNTLKSTTEKTIKEANEKIASLEQQLQLVAQKGQQSAPNNLDENPEDKAKITDLETTVARLSRELSVANDQNIKFTQKIASLKLKLQVSNQDSENEEKTAEQVKNLKKANNELDSQISALNATLQAGEKQLHEQEIRLKERDALRSELQQEIQQLRDTLNHERSVAANSREKEQNIPKEISEDKENSAEHNKTLELQIALQTHQSTISDLQQQCNSLRQEILERNEVHQREITTWETRNDKLEQTMNESLQTQAQKLRSYENAYEDIEKQLEQVFHQMNNLKNVSEQSILLNDEIDSLRSQLSLTQKDLSMHKELLHQERQNLEASKEIACDLQKHILQITQNHEELQRDLLQAQKAYEELQLKAVRQKKAFEQEKNAIVFDLLQKQSFHSDGDDDDTDFSDDHSYNFETPINYTPKNGNGSSSKRDEKRSLSLVKQKLIDELWKESWDMINSPKPSPNPRLS